MRRNVTRFLPLHTLAANTPGLTGSESDALEKRRTLVGITTVGGTVEALHVDIALEQPSPHQARNGGVYHRRRPEQIRVRDP